MIVPACSLFPGDGGWDSGGAAGGRRRRYVTTVALLVAVALLLLPVVLAYLSRPEPYAGRLATASPFPGAATPAPEPPPGAGAPPDGIRRSRAPAGAPAQFTGTDPFETSVDHAGGLMLVRVAYRGDGPFAVHVGAGRRQAPALVDVTGAYQGSRAFGLPAGTYRVGVVAGGQWGVAIEQPRYAEAIRLPRLLAGVGDTATRPFEVGAARTVRMAWTVERDAGGAGAADPELRVRVLDVSGVAVADLLVRDGDEVAQHLATGRYLLDVSTDAGVWRVLVS